MDYKEKYEQAIKRAKAMIKVANNQEETYNSVMTIFPELAESEDERVRKYLIELVKQSSEILHPRNQRNMLDWLKKQKDKDALIKELADSEDEKIRKDLIKFVDCNTLSTTEQHDKYIAWLEKQGKKRYSEHELENEYWRGYDDAKHSLEKQGEPAEINPTEFDTRLQALIGKFNSLPKEELIGSLSFWMNVVQNDGTYKEEKQGEQKPIFDVEIPFGAKDSELEEVTYDIPKGYHAEIKDNKVVIKKDEQKPANTVKDVWKDMRLEVWAQASGNREANVSCENTTMFSLCDIDEIIEKINDCQIKQKPAEWSEEDEKKLSTTIAYLLDVEDFPLNAEKCINWLKELKNRVLPQPTKEWDEKDEMMIKFALTYFRKAGATEDSDIIKWLKSLRPQSWTKEDKERYISCLQKLGTGNPEQPETINSKWFKEHVYPKPQWKPSNEQLKGIECAIKTLQHQLNVGDKRLNSLYEDLKKLREE